MTKILKHLPSENGTKLTPALWMRWIGLGIYTQDEMDTSYLIWLDTSIQVTQILKQHLPQDWMDIACFILFAWVYTSDKNTKPTTPLWMRWIPVILCNCGLFYTSDTIIKQHLMDICYLILLDCFTIVKNTKTKPALCMGFTSVILFYWTGSI